MTILFSVMDSPALLVPALPCPSLPTPTLGPLAWAWQGQPPPSLPRPPPGLPRPPLLPSKSSPDPDLYAPLGPPSSRLMAGAGSARLLAASWSGWDWIGGGRGKGRRNLPPRPPLLYHRDAIAPSPPHFPLVNTSQFSAGSRGGKYGFRIPNFNQQWVIWWEQSTVVGMGREWEPDQDGYGASDTISLSLIPHPKRSCPIPAPPGGNVSACRPSIRLSLSLSRTCKVGGGGRGEGSGSSPRKSLPPTHAHRLIGPPSPPITDPTRALFPLFHPLHSNPGPDPHSCRRPARNRQCKGTQITPRPAFPFWPDPLTSGPLPPQPSLS